MIFDFRIRIFDFSPAAEPGSGAGISGTWDASFPAMNENEMKQRTKTFALRVLKLIEALPETRSGRIVANQLRRSGTSVGANYRAVCRARSRADMISKLSIVEEEADESAYWLEIVPEAGLMESQKTLALLREASELTAIMVASRQTLLGRNRKSRLENRDSKSATLNPQ